MRFKLASLVALAVLALAAAETQACWLFNCGGGNKERTATAVRSYSLFGWAGVSYQPCSGGVCPTANVAPLISILPAGIFRQQIIPIPSAPAKDLPRKDLPRKEDPKSPPKISD